MDPDYQNSYPERSIDPHKLEKEISRLYQMYDFDKKLTYDELLFILDENCQSKADRDIAEELFKQSGGGRKTTTLRHTIIKYIENLETSKVCLLREEAVVQQLEKQLATVKVRRHSYIYLRILQATIYARYSP